MSTPAPPTGRPGSIPQTPDDRLREQGQQLITMISAVIRIGRAYSVTNQVFRTQLDSITNAIRAILTTTDEVVLVAIENDLYVNGIRLPVSSSNFRFHQTVVQLFSGRGISGFRADQSLNAEHLGKFFELFFDSTDLRGKRLLEACSNAGLTGIFPALHASTAPVEGGGSDGPEWDSGAEAAEGEADPAAADGERTVSTGTTRWRRTFRGAAKRYYTHALQGARSLLTTTSITNRLEMRHAKRVVQPLVDGAFASEPVVVGLSTLHDHDEYTYAHSVNVCAVAVTMGHLLGMDRRSLADLGVSALLHDVGKSAVADLIVHPIEAFTEEERAAAERHPIEGAKLLAQSTSLNSTTLRCMRVALEHHTGPDNEEGYPKLPRHWHTSLLSQIVSVSDCFVSLHTRRAELVEVITPHQALGMMLGPLRDRFEPALLWALVNSVGFYPPGQLVELDDGTIAIVLAPNKHDLARPHVRVITGPDKQVVPAADAQELLPIPPEMNVRAALKGDEYPEDPSAHQAA